MENSDSCFNVSVGALIYSRTTQRFLFLLRNAEKRFKGTWGLVGGRIDTGELLADGLAREVSEETGHDIAGCRIVPVETFTHTKNQFKYHTYVVVVEEEFIPFLNEEHRGYCWVGIDDYPKPLHPGVWKTLSFKSVVSKVKTITAS